MVNIYSGKWDFYDTAFVDKEKAQAIVDSDFDEYFCTLVELELDTDANRV